jgi:uncharacterized RDD family membrane protein YckC
MIPRPRPHHVIHHAQAEDFGVYERAGFIARWYAITFDLTFAAPLNIFVHLPFERYLARLTAFGHPTEATIQRLLLMAIPILLYFVVPTLLWGQTLGKRIVGLRVIRQDGEPRLGFGQVLVRETVGRALSLAMLGVGFLMAAAEPEKRAMHDVLTKTDVVSFRVKIAPANDKPGR